MDLKTALVILATASVLIFIAFKLFARAKRKANERAKAQELLELKQMMKTQLHESAFEVKAESNLNLLKYSRKSTPKVPTTKNVKESIKLVWKKTNIK